MMNDSWMKSIADDLHLSNPDIPSCNFESVLKSSRVWDYEWGVIFAVGNSLHIHVMSDFRKKVFLRKPLRQVAKEMFKEYPIIETFVSKQKPWALEFDLRLGWKLVSEDNDMWNLEMKEQEFRYGTL